MDTRNTVNRKPLSLSNHESSNSPEALELSATEASGEQDLKNLLMDFINSDEIDKDVILEDISHGITEMVDFMHQKPDQPMSFSKEDRNALHDMMMKTILNTESEEYSVLGESLFPEIIKNLELMINK